MDSSILIRSEGLMWVLSTSRAELHEFPSPEAIPGGYAILSHVWDREEQTFQVTQSLKKICEQTKSNPRDCSQPKIRQACILAESHGYAWLWVDTACIDKSSSADLSEAINSMYRYYSLARMCYAYLRDVPPAPMPFEQPFSQSRWHTRGWTLQELIAPIFVLFLAEDWTNIGTKAELADLLESVTHVPADLLRLRTPLSKYSLAQRMSWAAARVTSRPEDRAYSLLGIFGINMWTLYGEGGEQAFYRLQEEIMKRRADTTLFAWGSPLAPGRPTTEDRYLLAPSPDVFRDCGEVLFEPPEATAHVETWSTRGPRVNSERSGTITFSVTPYGVLAHVPLIEHWYEDSESDEVTAYLFWSDTSGNPIGLRLKPRSTSVDPFRPHYDVVEGRLGHLLRDSEGRLLDFRSHGRQVVRPTWQEIYITHRPLPESVVPAHTRGVFVPINLGSSVPFRVSDTDIDALPGSPLPLRLTACSPVSLPWNGSPPAVLQFERLTGTSATASKYYVMLHLGRCLAQADSDESARPSLPPLISGHHWAAIHFTTKDLETYLRGRESQNQPDHNCGRDHIDQWAWFARAFRIKRADDDSSETATDSDSASPPEAGSIMLRFKPCPVSPATTFIASISTMKFMRMPSLDHITGAPLGSPMNSPPAPLAGWPMPIVPGPQAVMPHLPDPGQLEGEYDSDSHTAVAGWETAVPLPVVRLEPPSSPSALVSESAHDAGSPPGPAAVVPPPPGHGELAYLHEGELELEDDATATTETSMLQGPDVGRDGDGGDGWTLSLRDEPVATTPAEPLRVMIESEGEVTDASDSPMTMDSRVANPSEPATDSGAEAGTEEPDSQGFGGGEATDKVDEVDAEGRTPEGTEELEGAGLGDRITSTGSLPSSRQTTPPPKTWSIFPFLEFKFWSR